MSMKVYEKICPRCKTGFQTEWTNQYSFFEISPDAVRGKKEGGDRIHTFCSNTACNWIDEFHDNVVITNYHRINSKSKWVQV